MAVGQALGLATLDPSASDTALMPFFVGKQPAASVQCASCFTTSCITSRAAAGFDCYILVLNVKVT